MRLLRHLAFWLMLAPAVALAAPGGIPQIPGFIDVCGADLGLPCRTGGAAAIAGYTLDWIIPALQYMFYAIAILFFFYYAVRLIIESEDENTLTEVKSAYGYAIGGAVAVSLADNVVRGVGVGFASDTLIEPEPITDGIELVVLFLRLMVSAAVSGMIVYLGFRMILLQGQEAEMEQQKKRFFYGLIGVAVVLLADSIIRGFIPTANVGSSGLAAEIVGIINFLLELLGALAVLALIIAGIMLVVSTNEDLKDRAKKTVFTTVITLIVVLASYVIVNFVVGVAGDGTTGTASVGLLPFLHGILIEQAYAQPISGSANNVSNGLMAGFGGGGFAGIALFLRERVMLLFYAVGVFVLVRAGIRLISSQDENKLTTARRTIASTCVGIMLAHISLRIVNAVYAPGGTWSEGTVRTGADILTLEIAGIIDWVLVLLAAVAILMIVATGIRAIAGFGKDDGVADLRRSVAGVITGIGMILIAGAVKLTLGLNPDVEEGGSGIPDASVIILKGIMIVQAVLQFLALVAVAIIIYAGLMMILNLGNEDQFNKAKSLIYRAVIGLVIVLLSGLIAVFVTNLLL